ncbi:hypothetical protein BpHYR1_019198 [Brachionus plicatilis]|uniref:Uncharacterized protein n=1 Tax=Brachionus plicatilis TaxID=10195 RepID=A0A3M7S5V7_BRAPC|nr:hypothetical protein BpHYR1_019198 [Brachionus plicatilis]
MERLEKILHLVIKNPPLIFNSKTQGVRIIINIFNLLIFKGLEKEAPQKIGKYQYYSLCRAIRIHKTAGGNIFSNKLECWMKENTCCLSFDISKIFISNRIMVPNN